MGRSDVFLRLHFFLTFCSIMASLDAKQQAQLLEDPSNPDPNKVSAPVVAKATTKVAPLKETIAARKKAKLAELKRPDSAQPSPARVSTSVPRPATSMATSSKVTPSLSKSLAQTGTLSSAPVRPMKQTRKLPPPRKADSPKSEAKGTQPRKESPKPKANSPKLKAESPKPKTDSPKPKADSPIPKTDGPKQKVDGPKPKVSSSNLTAKGNVAPTIASRHTAEYTPVASALDTPLSVKGDRAYQAQCMVQEMGLKIFEDPGMPTLKVTKTRQAPRPTVLEEIALNNSTSISPKLLNSAITRLRGATLDMHGFRKLQNLIKFGESIWEDTVMFDQLLLTLLECLESPDTTMRGQVLLTVRMMLSEHQELFATFFPRALCAILDARRFYESSTHLACGLEETADDIIVFTSDPDTCIDAVLDFLETISDHETASRTISMGLFVLNGLLKHGTPLASDVAGRLAKLALKSLTAADSTVRSSAINFCMAMSDCIKPPQRFWDLVSSASPESKSLLTYYLARRAT